MHSHLRLSLVSTAAAALLTVASLALAGCGMGIAANPVNEVVIGKLQMEGTVLGGSIPVQGATLTIWKTDPTNSGYPSSSVPSSSTKTSMLLATTYTTGTAIATSTLSGSGVGSITVGNGGGGYSSATPPMVTVAAPASGTTATATANVGSNGNITSITVNTAGTGYTSAPAITIDPPAGAAGSFSFNSSYSCGSNSVNTPSTGSLAGPFLYLVSTGGNTGGGVNKNAVLVNALGSCSYLLGIGTSKIHVTVNEATTVAAAYSLGNFIYVDNTTLGSQNVYIGAPANNNVATGACANSGSSMVCSSAGLEHGFWNAYNLVDGLCVNGSSCASSNLPGAEARSTIPANADAGTNANANGYIPQDYVNGIADILAACVNSASTTNNSNVTTPSTNCKTLFDNADGLNAVKPVDTLTAAINMARNPNHNVSNLYGLVTASSPFTTTLTGTPHDLSISIFYTTGSSTLGYPQALALDANDHVYATLTNSSTENTNATFGGTDAGVVSLTSNGSSAWLVQGLAASKNYCAPAFIATDTLGNVWWTNKVGTTSVCGSYTSTNDSSDKLYAIVGFSQASPVTTTHTFTSSNISGTPNGIAVDRSNNIWYDEWLSTTSVIKELPYNSGTSTYGTQVAYTGASGAMYNLLGPVLVDGNQNVWASSVEGNATTGQIVVAPNTATSGNPPTYSTSGLMAASQGTATYNYGFAIDSSNNIWVGADNAGTGAFWEITETTNTNGVITGVAFPSGPTVSQTNGSTPLGSQFDSAGTLFYGYTTSGYLYYAPAPVTGTADFRSLAPCTTTIPSGTSTCLSSGGTYPGANVYGLQIDSTGAMWLAENDTANGYLVQVLGAAAPVWPQLSYAKFATAPQ